MRTKFNVSFSVTLLSYGVGAWAATHYVDLNCANPTPPYTNWATAATVIQAAVDAAVAGDEVFVTNGIYTAGGRAIYPFEVTNRVAVDRRIDVRSINGPQFTVINGQQAPGVTNGFTAIRGAYLTNGASLSGFTLTNGATQGDGFDEQDQSGGGVWCESSTSVVSNCVLVGNSAFFKGGGVYGGRLVNCTLSGNSANWGGGVSGGVLDRCILSGNSATVGGGASGLDQDCTLNNCRLISNSVSFHGGGAANATLNNCTVVGNSSPGSLQEKGGAGTWVATLNNCILYFNVGDFEGWNYRGGTLYHCCTTPLPGEGIGNITNSPSFVSYATGDLRLQPDSPCINGGDNNSVPGGPDLDGDPRIVGATVDIGAYELQNPTSVLAYAWLQRYGLPTDGSADFADPDGDGMNNWQEWRCGTDPTNALSALRLLSAFGTTTEVTVTWQSVAGVNYLLERSSDLGASPPFVPVAAAIPGQPGTTSYLDTNTAGQGQFFYRVGVRN